MHLLPGEVRGLIRRWSEGESNKEGMDFTLRSAREKPANFGSCAREYTPGPARRRCGPARRCPLGSALTIF